MLNMILPEISHSHSLTIPTALFISHLDLVMQINFSFYSFLLSIILFLVDMN